METVEDVKQIIDSATSLSTEAKNASEGAEIEMDVSLQQMGALLASNCQKLSITPSSHTCENSADCFREIMNQEKDLGSGAAEDDNDDGDEYETVIYDEPEAPDEIIEKTNHPQNDTVPPDVKLKIMNARLAQTSAEHEGLLTPRFFLQSPDVSSVDSSSNTGASLDLLPNQEIVETSAPDSHNGSGKKSPFSFPAANLNAEVVESPADTVVHEFERVEILDGDPSDENQTEWVDWPKKYIESKGFCLGVQPGNFFKDLTRQCFYVKLPHLSNYEVLVTNNNQVPCDLDLYVNGKPVTALRLSAGTTRSIDGPLYSDYAFKLYRAKDVPADKKVTEGDKMNGVVKAVFTPCIVGDSRLRAVSEPLRAGTRMPDFLDLFDDTKDVKKQRSVTVGAGTRMPDFLDLFDDTKDVKKQRSVTVGSNDEDITERSLDVSRVVEGVTLLQGKQKKKNYVLAPEIDTDPSKRVILQLRLIASLDEEVDATGEIYEL